MAGAALAPPLPYHFCRVVSRILVRPGVTVNSATQMSVYPLDEGTAERVESSEASVQSGIRRWSAYEAWVGWEEEWKVGIIQRYFRCWFLFRLPLLPDQLRAVFRIHLNRADPNWAPLELALYATEGEEWCRNGQRLGSLGTVQPSEKDRWLEMDLPPAALRANDRNYLELRSEPEETRGFDTRVAAAFDLLSPRPRAEIILSWG